MLNSPVIAWPRESSTRERLGVMVETKTTDPEMLAINLVVGALAGLPDDESRRRVMEYARSRCIKPLPPPTLNQSMAANLAQVNLRQQG